MKKLLLAILFLFILPSNLAAGNCPCSMLGKCLVINNALKQKIFKLKRSIPIPCETIRIENDSLKTQLLQLRRELIKLKSRKAK